MHCVERLTGHDLEHWKFSTKIRVFLAADLQFMNQSWWAFAFQRFSCDDCVLTVDFQFNSIGRQPTDTNSISVFSLLTEWDYIYRYLRRICGNTLDWYWPSRMMESKRGFRMDLGAARSNGIGNSTLQHDWRRWWWWCCDWKMACLYGTKVTTSKSSFEMWFKR